MILIQHYLTTNALHSFPTRRSSDLRARQELCERVAHHYGEDWWFLTMYGWAMTENGNVGRGRGITERGLDRKSTRLNSSHMSISYAVFCLKKKKNKNN